jgi:hypothetical protein
MQPVFGMRPSALLIVLLAGGTSIAVAQPSSAEDRETTARVTYNDRARRAAAPDDWTVVATPTPASHAREYIEVDPDRGSLVRLRIEASSGRPIVRAVRLDYKNGKSRVVQLDRVLEKGKPAYVDLAPGQRLERIVVTSEGSAKASYAIYGSTSTGGVATR